ncbi:Vesicle transport protein S20 [Chamberlinius hualienensis]
MDATDGSFETRHKDSRVVIVIHDIIKFILAGKALVQDIQNSVGSEQELNELYREVQKTIHSIRNNIEELDLLGKEQDRDTDQQEVFSDVANFKKQLNGLQQALRKANFEAQLSVEKRARATLLAEDQPLTVRQRIHKDKEAATKMSTDITNNLLSISRTLANEVIHSEESLQRLVGSSQKITDTQEEFKSMGGTIHQSRKLLSKYNRRELTDRVLILLAIAFFFACVLYVLKGRIF